MPSPLGHAMAGAMTAWVAEAWWSRRSSRLQEGSSDRTAVDLERADARTPGHSALSPDRSHTPDRWLAAVADLISPLAVACTVLAISPDFDVFLHTHRTYSHSLGAAAIVWGLVALIAWRFRLPVVRTATICAAAYASHVLLDWLGRDDSRLAGPMALWPLTTLHFKSGLDLFLEFTVLHRRRFDVIATLVRNAPALAREVLILGGPFLVVMKFRLTHRGTSLPVARDASSAPRLGRTPVMPEEPG